LDYREFRRYLSDYLRRRGFDYETIRSVVARLWQERQPGLHSIFD
jgi:SOS response regulatory protein OraA/RecX